MTGTTGPRTGRARVPIVDEADADDSTVGGLGYAIRAAEDGR
ncbi:hypothetical protein ACFXKY_19845 [Streptomyces canus]